jgi:hypothetical protein
VFRRDIESLVISLACFGGILIAAGKPDRLAPTLTALVGVGAIVMVAWITFFSIGTALFAPSMVQMVAQAILLWLVVVKGHIIARATGWHWYAGLLVSVGVLLLQLVVDSR